MDIKITITLEELQKMAASAAQIYAPDIQPGEFHPVYDQHREEFIGLEANMKGETA